MPFRDSPKVVPVQRRFEEITESNYSPRSQSAARSAFLRVSCCDFPKVAFVINDCIRALPSFFYTSNKIDLQICYTS